MPNYFECPYSKSRHKTTMEMCRAKPCHETCPEYPKHYNRLPPELAMYCRRFCQKEQREQITQAVRQALDEFCTA